MNFETIACLIFVYITIGYMGMWVNYKETRKIDYSEGWIYGVVGIYLIFLLLCFVQSTIFIFEMSTENIVIFFVTYPSLGYIGMWWNYKKTYKIAFKLIFSGGLIVYIVFLVGITGFVLLCFLSFFNAIFEIGESLAWAIKDDYKKNIKIIRKKLSHS